MAENDLFNSFNSLFENDVDKVLAINNNQLFALIRWLSFEPSNFRITERVDKYNKSGVNKDLLKALLFFGVNKNKRYIKYLKKEIVDEELDDDLKKYFGYSTNEFNKVESLIDKKDAQLLIAVSKALGWDKVKCKKYGLTFKEPEKEFLTKKKVSLFDFS